MLHAKQLAARRVLANKSLVIRALAATKPAAASYVVRIGFKYFTASLILAFLSYSLSARKAATCFGAVPLVCTRTAKRLLALLTCQVVSRLALLVRASATCLIEHTEA
jgi:hypothetical protein